MAMTDAQFREFWEALDNAVRAAMQPDPASAPEAAPAQPPSGASGKAEAPARDPASTTTTTAERAPAVWHRPPAPARAFGFEIIPLEPKRMIKGSDYPLSDDQAQAQQA